jgi:hypothetical protein
MPIDTLRSMPRPSGPSDSPRVLESTFDGVTTTAPPRSARRRGRPVEMPPATLLERIQKLAARREGLFRIHRTHRDLYSRARRQFGSWAAAVRAAGVDYEFMMRRARARSLEKRRRLPRRPRKTDVV